LADIKDKTEYVVHVLAPCALSGRLLCVWKNN